MSRSRYTKAQREGARLDLLEWIKPGDTIYCITRTVARSGMQRRVTVHAIRDGKLYEITRQVAWLLDYSRSDGLGGPALVVKGAGMDMHFHVVYHLAHELFGNQGGYSLDKVSI